MSLTPYGDEESGKSKHLTLRGRQRLLGSVYTVSPKSFRSRRQSQAGIMENFPNPRNIRGTMTYLSAG